MTGNAAIVNDGTRGYVLDLDGDGDYVSLGTGTWTNPGNHATIAAWVKVNSFPSNQLYTILAKGLKTYRMARDSGSNNLLTVNANYTSSSYKYVTSTSNINVGWHHAAMTYDGTNMKLYIDGNLESTNTLSTLVHFN